MTGQAIHEINRDNGMAPAGPSASAMLFSTHKSSRIAKTLEYQLVGELGAELLSRGQGYDVLKSDVDDHGHDLVIGACGVVRHIQLKSQMLGGKSRKVTCHTHLQSKPSGCVIWVTYDPATYRIVRYAFFGGAAGEALTDPGDRIPKRSTHNAKQVRPERALHRELKYTLFEITDDVADLVEWLFVKPAEEQVLPAEPTVIYSPPGNLMMVKFGRFSVLPMSTNMTSGIALVSVLAKNAGAGELIEMAGPGSDGTLVLLDLNAGTWELNAELRDDPELAALLVHTVELLKRDLSQPGLEAK